MSQEDAWLAENAAELDYKVEEENELMGSELVGSAFTSENTEHIRPPTQFGNESTTLNSSDVDAIGTPMEIDDPKKPAAVFPKSPSGNRKKVKNVSVEMKSSSDVLEPRKDPDFRSAIRKEALHLHGVDKLSTTDIEDYFASFGSCQVEWINDSSCNVVFMTETLAEEALLNFGKPEPGKSDSKSEKKKPSEGKPVAKPGLSVPISLRYATFSDVKLQKRPRSRKLWVRTLNAEEGEFNGSGEWEEASGEFKRTKRNSPVTDLREILGRRQSLKSPKVKLDSPSTPGLSSGVSDLRQLLRSKSMPAGDGVERAEKESGSDKNAKIQKGRGRKMYDPNQWKEYIHT